MASLLSLCRLVALVVVVVGVVSDAVNGQTVIYANQGCSGTGSGQINDPFCDLNAAFVAAVNAATSSSSVRVDIRGSWQITSTINLALPTGASLSIGGSPNISCINAGIVLWNINAPGGDVLLEDAYITQCNPVFTILDVKNFTVLRSTFEKCSGITSAISVIQSESISFASCSFIGNSRQLGTGGVFTIDATESVSFDQCNFIENYAGAGGGVASISTPSLSITNSWIKHNVGLGPGGSIIMSGPPGSSVHIKNATFLHDFGTQGGSLWIDASDITIEDSIFANSSSTLTGGAAHIQNFDSLTIRDSSFSGLFCVQIGGALYLTGSSASVLLEGSNFMSNVGNSSGGAVYLNGAKNLTVVSTVFQQNVMAYSGGAVWVTDDGGPFDATFRSSKFLSNYALNVGGAGVYFESSSASSPVNMVWDTVVFHNNGPGRGASIYLNLLAASNYLKILNCIFSRNYVPSDVGAGLSLITATTGTSLTVQNTTFKQNQAIDGPGIWAFDKPNVISITDSSFDENLILGSSVPINAGVARLKLAAGSEIESTVFANAWLAATWNLTAYGALSISCASSDLQPAFEKLQIVNNGGLAGIYVDNCSPSLEYSILYGNWGPGIVASPSVGVVNASEDNSIYNNAVFQSLDILDIACASPGQVLIANGEDGCACPIRLDICSVCNGTGTSCTSPGCPLPYRTCDQDQTTFAPDTSILGLDVGLYSGSSDAIFKLLDAQQQLPVQLKFLELR